MKIPDGPAFSSWHSLPEVPSSRTLPQVPSSRTLPYFAQRRLQVARNGVAAAPGADDAMVDDDLFASPTTAACALLGRSSNGRKAWKPSDGRPLNEIQEGEEGK